MPNINSKNESLKIRLGSDLKFPIQTSFEPIEGLDLLLQDIQQLLLTIPGERVFRPEFGCFLRNQVWENLDDALINGKASIRSSLDNFEPRIDVTSVGGKVNSNTGLITFSINFVVKDTDTSVNLIFPFRATTQLSTA